MPVRSSDPRQSTFVELLRERVGIHPERSAFAFLQDGSLETERWTYADLDRRARAIAADLQARGLSGERALLLYNPGLDFVAGFFGCLYAGVTAVPAYPPRSNQLMNRLAAIIEDAQVAVALTVAAGSEAIAERLRDLGPAAPQLLIATDAIDPAGADGWRMPASDPDDLAFLQYTSGSTGHPKGVMVSHANLLHNSRLINLCFEDTPESLGVSWLPPYHDMGLVGGILQPLYVGSTMVVIPPVSFLQRPLRWLEAISRYRATTAGGPNFAYEFCARQIRPEQLEGLDLSSWTLAFTGAEPVRAETIDLFCETFGPCGFRREAFLPCYGLAENTLIVSGGGKGRMPVVRRFDAAALVERRVLELADPRPGSEGADPGRTLVASGPAVGDVGLRIVDPDSGLRLADGQIGEIWVSGASVARGYRNQEQRSLETFQARLEGDPSTYLRTGDLGFVLDGELFVNGRIKDLIIIRGRNHYPQDIEASVETSHPALRTGCGAAFSVEEDGEERLVLVQEVERSALRRLDADTVTAAIRAAVSEQHQLQPAAILLLKTGAIPKTSSGKIQRFACRQRYLEGSLDCVGEWRQPAAATLNPGDANSSPGSAPGAGPAQPEQAAVAAGPPEPAASPGGGGFSPRERRIHAWFRDYLSSRLGLQADAIDLHTPLSQYGLDSMAAVRLTADLEDWLAEVEPERPRLTLAPTLAYDHPDIARIAAALVQAGAGDAAAGAEAASAGAGPRPLRDDDVVVVGLGCRFPGAASPEAFWQLLERGAEAVRTAAAAAALDRGAGAAAADRAGYLEAVDRFDAAFFGIPPREAAQMDPQQRLLLECTWEAFEQAGIPPERWAGSRAGVFVGISSSDYAQLQPSGQTSVYWGTGNAHSIAANRLSYLLDLRGPSLAIDTACSSSLVAVHQAVRSLQLDDCSQALVAGVNILLTPALTDTFRQAGMLAADGRCKPFDAEADGYVRGEGCGVVLLKRLADARRDGDRIWGVIRGSAVTQDGRSNGLTAPSGLAQQAVVTQALAGAGVPAAAIGYVETHGTGTALGDPIEVNALSQVLAAGRQHDQPCWLGSVKANLGHLEAAAGIAGLIKVLLCFRHGSLPPHPNLRNLNPLIRLGPGSPLAINTSALPWQGSERHAGVSSFGFGGTNAHLIVGAPPVEALVPAPSEQADRPCHLLTLSARSEAALDALRRCHADLLSSTDPSPERLADHCFTANAGRSQLPFRDAWIGADARELAAALRSGSQPRRCGDGPPTLAFLFTGQGSQYPGMAAELLASQPLFAAVIDRCDIVLAELGVLPDGVNLRSLLSPCPEGGEDSGRLTALLERTAVTQPVLFSLEVALARLWMSWGVRPDWVMGHSVGEYAAACIAGVFDLEDGLRLIAARARLMDALPAGGGMLAVFSDAASVATLLAELTSPLVIAADNGPGNVVVSGTLEAIGEMETRLESRGLARRRLRVSHAFHSPLMEPMLAEFRAIAAGVAFREPTVPILSNISHAPAGRAMADPDYWCRHVLAPVAFADSLRCLSSEGVDCFLEIGPKPTLLEMARAGGLDAGACWLESLRPGRSDTRQLLTALAELHRRGTAIDWAGFDAPFPRRRLELPTYPWQRQRHWLPELRSGIRAMASADPALAPDDRDGPHLLAPRWLPQPLPASPISQEPPEGQWLLFGPRSIQEGLLRGLPAGQICCWIETAGAFQEVHPRHWRLDPGRREHWQALFDALAAGPRILGILDVVTHDASSGQDAEGDGPLEPATGGVSSIEPLLRASRRLPALARAILERPWPSPPPRLWWLTPASDPGTVAEALLQGAALGFGRSLAVEHPGLWGGWLQLPEPGSEAGAALLLRELAAAADPAEAGLPAELAVRHLQGVRQVQRLVRLPVPSGTTPDLGAGALPVCRDGAVLISGGLGALGLATARWLLEQGVAGLILVGRRPPGAEAMALLESWRSQGAAVRVLQADVADPAFRTSVAECLDGLALPLRGIIHAAGVLEDASVERLDPEAWERVLRPKLAGAWALHALSLDHPVRVFLLYSSLAALLGSPGQSAYAAANAGLDALAAHRRALGLPALSLDWGPWSGAGMADVGQGRSGRSLASYGVEPQPPAAQFALLERLLGPESNSVALGSTGLPPSVAIARLQPQLLADLMAGRPQRSFLAELAPPRDPVTDGIAAREGPDAGSDSLSQPDSPTRPAASSQLAAQLLAVPAEARADLILNYLRGTLARLLGLDEDRIDPQLHLMEAAADSLMVMDAISQIQRDLNLMIYPREIYEHPRVGALAAYLAEAFSRSNAGAEEDAAVQRPPATGIDLPAALALPATLRHQPVATERKLPGAVFVLSSPRAGSTLFRVMLAGHPQLFSPPELHLLPFATMGERARALRQSGLGEGLERALVDLEGLDPGECRRLLQSWEEEDLPVASVYGRLQALAGGRQLVDKSPTYALHLETLRQAEAIFDRPRYIHLVRHPYSVIRSFVDLRMDRLFGARDGDPHRLAEAIWRTCNENVLQLQEELGDDRVKRVLYETLVTRPEQTLQDLCAFLGIAFDPALLAPYEGSRLTDGLHRQSLSVGDPNFGRHRGIEASLAEAWRSVRLPWPLEESSQRLAERFGYSLPRERAGSPEPVPARAGATQIPVPVRTAAPAAGQPPVAASLPMREASLEVGGLRLWRCEWGPEEGPPVLCLHGLLDQGLIWEPVAQRLAAAGFRVIAPDLRGHGRSDHVGAGGSYQSLDFIGDAVAQVDRLLARPFVLIGHSLGSVVAAGLTSLRESLVERLVMIEPVLPGSAGGADVRSTLDTLVSYALEPPRHSSMADREAAVERLRRALPSLSGDFAARLVDRATRPQGDGLIWRWDPALQTRMSLNLQTGPLHRAAYLRLLGELKPPVTLIQGAASGFNRPEDLRDLRSAMAGAEQLLLEGGHTLMVDNPDGVAQALLEALRATVTP